MKFLLLLTVFIFDAYAAYAQNLIVAAPNTFRLDSKETVAIALSNYDQPVEVTVLLQDYPGKTTILASQKVTIIKGQPKIVELLLESKKLLNSQKDDTKLFVNLVATTNTNVLPKKEVAIPVTRFAGYAFIQTDKPLYLPEQKVNIRVLYLDEKLLPLENVWFTLEIKNPRGDRVMFKEMSPDPSGITEVNFDFPKLPVFGNWSATVHYGYKLSGQSTVRFEVKEYTLPTYLVKINPPKVILSSDQIIKGEVQAIYVYGKPVEGYANLNFKVRNRQGQITDLGSQRNLELRDGKVTFNLRVEKDVKKKVQWFPEIDGSAFVVEAIVIEKATGKSSDAVDDTTIFTTTPYIISFQSSMKEFKPGVPYQVVAEVRYITKELPKTPVQVELKRAYANKSDKTNRDIRQGNVILTNREGRAVFSVDTEANDLQLDITVKTKDEAFGEGNQAVNNIIVNKYNSPVANTYVWIAVPHEGTTFRVGSPFETKVHVSSQGHTINYMVVSKGRILVMNETRTQDALVRTVQFLVTADMVPVFRVLVYIIKDNKVIADSLQINVEKRCKYNDGKELVVEAHTNAGVFSPGSDVKFKIRGEPMSKVGVVAVDEAVYIINKQDLLTRDKMFNEMKKHDLGHGPGGGINPASVFRNAGIQVLTNAIIDPHSRQEAIQLANRRRKRSLINNKVDDYSGAARTCCRMGLLEGPPNMDCATRASKIYEAIEDTHNCSVAFLDCCETSLKLRAAHQNLMGRGIADQFDADTQLLIDTYEQDVLKNLRHIFPETWFFNTYTVGADKNCRGQDRSVCEVTFTAPHSITTWMIQAVGVSKTNGMCVSNSLQVPVFKPMFIQLDLPVSSIRGEQIEVLATVFNYGDAQLPVTLYMYGVEGLCMGAGPGERSEHRKIVVEPNNAASVTFPVMPLQLGEFPIKVVALSWSSSDAIQKMLKVVPEGSHDEQKMSFTLDPSGFYSKRRKREEPHEGVKEEYDENAKKQMIQVELPLPHNHIPDTGRCYISVIGSNLGQAINTSVSGLESFVQLPRGCGEQTMIFMAPLVYTMSFLKRSNQMTAAMETKGYDFITKGYAHELNYRKPDGSFAVWANHPSSTWLTAFVSKVFCQANSFIHIETEHMCQSMIWLQTRQHHTGAFFDNGTLIHKEMTGGVQGDVSLTAFVLISMLECDQCNSPQKNIALRRAVQFLEQHVPFMQRPYTIALVAYALGLASSTKAHEANEKLKGIVKKDEVKNEYYWNWDASEFGGGAKPWVYQHHPTAVAVETTSYALLTQLLHGDLEFSHPIVNWLNKQRTSKGSFVSTQDTVVALQALSEYNVRAKFPELDMVCNISSSASNRQKRSIVLNQNNAFVLHELEIPATGRDKLFLDVTGKGIATMGIALHYNVEQGPEKICKFDLNVTIEELNEVIQPAVIQPEFDGQPDFLPVAVVRSIMSEEVQQNKFGYEVVNNANNNNANNRVGNANGQGESQHIVKINICVRYLELRTAGMSILDVGLFTGYQAQMDTLNNLTKNAENKVSNFEISDRSVILYLEEVPHDKPLCVSFRSVRSIMVGRVQPTAVRIYDYYEPKKSCTKFYGPDNSSYMMKKICEGRQCFCLSGMCPSSKAFRQIGEFAKDSERRTELLNMACDRHDYVWNGTLENAYTNGSFKYYKYKISDVMKAGTEKDEELLHETVTFIAQSACSHPEMKVGEVYIIMGEDGKPYKTEDDETKFKYMINKKSSIHHSRPLKNIRAKKDQLIQKAINSLYFRLAVRKEGCSH